ncbi:hypothetical protein TIFTF001_015658 [Ficus carica]|uniref:Uncharacterized protein n=1 Tax=Ficus carica TaxID=3494 RepID=A0AA88D963_FICCA|nr:hypothetical protein TIFTF001_015658 [Ficus carica]
MAVMLTAYPKFLHGSLAKRIMPSYEFLRDLFQSDEKVIKAVKRSPDILISVGKRFGGEGGYVEHVIDGFSMPYEEEAPELLKLYDDKLDLSKRPEI